MMEAMLHEAVDWQKRGMPLQLLKIVLFSRDLRPVGRDAEALKVFATWKKKLEAGRKLVRFKVRDCHQRDFLLLRHQAHKL